MTPRTSWSVPFAALVAPATLVLTTSPALAAKFHRDSLAIPEASKVTISKPAYEGLVNPNPRGWYYKCANIVQAKDGALVASWQLSDNHTSLMSYLMSARSTDGGRTWSDYRVISKANVWEDHAIWVVPQMSVLRDGRIVIIVDRGHRTAKDQFPMLTDWQKPGRGMWNHAFWSSDGGKTWSKGEKIDDVGGEPGYALELSDGSIAYTRTSSQKTDKLEHPPAPWNDIYYRNEIVFSRDGGKTWPEAHWLADSPFHGDCEVGLCELAPNKLIAATRIGLGGGKFGHPSRLIYSDDNGRTWPRAIPAPFYGQRTHLRKLQSGKLLVTYRNVWGTPSTRALVFDPNERLGFEPNSWIVDESRCELGADALTLRTAEGKRAAVEFNFYPAQDSRSRVEIEATLRVEQADIRGCKLGAGCWVSITPERVFLTARPAAGFAIDARKWHTYRVVRGEGRIAIWVDGEKKLDEAMGADWAREVRFGNSSSGGGAYARNASLSQWRAVAIKVKNQDDYSIDWSWTPAKGYPDQFRRDRTVVLDHAYPADCGYSMWTQLPDGKIVIVDYTSLDLDSYVWGKPGEGKAPIVRAYFTSEKELTR